MNNISIADILELPVQERIRPVELICDSVAAVSEAVEVSPALKTELEVRLEEFEKNPEAGYFWNEGKLEITDNLRPKYKRSDFGEVVPDKYASHIKDETNVVLLEPDVAQAFPNDDAVNKTLRYLMEVAETSTRLTKHQSL